jgi:hypothetical protein
MKKGRFGRGAALWALFVLPGGARLGRAQPKILCPGLPAGVFLEPQWTAASFYALQGLSRG